MIIIEYKRNYEAIQRQYSNVLIVDVSSKNHILNPFYPHKRIRVPFTDGYSGISVAAIWNSLMVFEDADVDMDLRNIRIHTLVRKHNGKFVGIRQGYFNNYIMDVVEARKKILIPMYRWMLEQKVFPVILKLREIMQQRDIVLLNDSVNCDIDNINHPLSHAWLIKSYVEGLYPYEDVYGIREITKVVMVGQHMYNKIKEEKYLKEIKLDYVDSRLRFGLDYNN